VLCGLWKDGAGCRPAWLVVPCSNDSIVHRLLPNRHNLHEAWANLVRMTADSFSSTTLAHHKTAAGCNTQVPASIAGMVDGCRLCMYIACEASEVSPWSCTARSYLSTSSSGLQRSDPNVFLVKCLHIRSSGPKRCQNRDGSDEAHRTVSLSTVSHASHHTEGSSQRVGSRVVARYSSSVQAPLALLTSIQLD
jgi:hypothetical protein